MRGFYTHYGKEALRQLLDHIYGGGQKERKELGGSTRLYIKLRENNYPTDRYRLLCMSCNASLGYYGYCPHEKERAENRS